MGTPERAAISFIIAAVMAVVAYRWLELYFKTMPCSYQRGEGYNKKEEIVTIQRGGAVIRGGRGRMTKGCDRRKTEKKKNNLTINHR